MPLIPAAEYRPDISDYGGTSTKAVLNCVPQGDGYGPFPSFAQYTQALPGPCRGAFYALQSNGSVVTFAATATKLYKLDNTDFTWIDVSADGGSYTSVDPDAQWQFAQTGNLVFATQANHALQVFDLSSASAFSAALGSPPPAAYITVVGGFLVLSGLLSQPFRIMWSGLNSFNAANSWTVGVNSCDFQDFADGGNVRGVAGGDQFGVIFQDQAIRTMAYVPGSPVIFQIDKLADGIGLHAPYSIIRRSNTVYFYATQGYHRIVPGGAPEPIGRERVDRSFVKDFDASNPQLFMGTADPRSSRIYWAYKSVSGSSGLYDKLLGFDTVLNRFFPISASGECLLGISQSGITLESLDAVAPGGSLDALTVSLDDYPTSFAPQLGQIDSAHKLGFFSGPPLEATIDSAEQSAGGRRLVVSGYVPVSDAPAIFGRYVYRETLQATPVIGREVGLSARTGRIDGMRDARFIRFRNRIPAGSSWTFFGGVEPDAQPGGAI